MNAEALKVAIEAMPVEVQDELKRMRSTGRGLLGKMTIQTIVDRHLRLLVWLRKELQADHAVLSMLLHLHGISDPDGQPLTVGTVSSAFSRAVKAAELTKLQVEIETSVKTESRMSPKRSAPAPAAAPRPARRRPTLGAEANGLGNAAAPAPAKMPIALEPLALPPSLEAPSRLTGHPEIRRADHARLMTLIDPTQED